MEADRRPRPLAEPEIAARLAGLAAWTREGRCLVRDVTFDSWAACVDFVNRVARRADEVDHHPDVSLSWRRVTIRLTSHDAAGITSRDFRLAGMIEAMIAPPDAGAGGEAT